MTRRFPPDFLWGAATSGYQVEGAPEADGKGRSIWDTFTHAPGKTLHGDTGDLACRAYDERTLMGDLDLMATLGLGAYIFSVQWPRIQPDGRGRANARGLDYYRRLVDGLCARNILPALTLYHWELPQALQDRGGGWLNRDTVDRFVAYAGLLHDALAPQVPLWITQNEPHTSAWLGYGQGVHAPGMTGGNATALRAAHHLLLSHGRVIHALRRRAPNTRIGPVLNVTPVRPADPGNPADRAAAVRVDGEQNRLFFDPIFRGTYPADLLERHREATDGFSFVQPGDMDHIRAPLDFLGVNYYTPTLIAAAGPDGQGLDLRPPRGPTTAMGWAIDPAGLRESLCRVRDEYSGPLPLFISENGISCRDYLDPEGRCHDPERVEFLRAHLVEAHRAVAEDGVPLRGYFVWSLLDNFEWDSGYRERFGLVYTDYPSGQRTPKDSFAWYRGVIAHHGITD